ncbi:UNVERIFIED_CONTAM: hypothetical protein Sradi_1652400 [Sesamum radiatum]|uniref:Bifunctional inhibitor/plant lipid transfer protein/seed storage helical domain-containing protein n=1 Tax=Sesamum radiatum TaxID=300843 RepID=A0AAW2UC13_SESRA
MNHILLLLVLLLYCLSVTSTAADSPPTTASTGCSDELVTFSTCLPYVAVFPNNLTDSPSPLCCDDVAAVFGNGSSVCLCYFLLRPKILGFPLNSTKLLSLTSVCQLKDKSSKADLSIGTLCSGSAALPPLQSITGPSNAKSRNNGKMLRS